MDDKSGDKGEQEHDYYMVCMGVVDHVGKSGEDIGRDGDNG